MTPVLAVGLDIEETVLPVGRIALHDHRALFEYDRGFLDRGIEPAPVNLKVLPGVHAAPRQPFAGLHGLFADSLPDSYGRLLVDRRLRQLGRDPNALTLLDRLALVGRRGSGALTYDPVDDLDPAFPIADLDLDRLQHEALEVIEGEPSEMLPLLQRLGGSAGGARPQALVWLSADRTRMTAGPDAPADPDAEPWIVKFRAPVDPRDLGPVEFAYLAMAEACASR